MIIGGWLGIGQESQDWIEHMILLSVAVAGLLMMNDRTIHTAIAIVLFAFFGYCHGYAHGVEMPADTFGFQYISGFTLGVLMLIGIAYLLKLLIEKVPSFRLNKISAVLLIGFAIYHAMN